MVSTIVVSVAVILMVFHTCSARFGFGQPKGNDLTTTNYDDDEKDAPERHYCWTAHSTHGNDPSGGQKQGMIGSGKQIGSKRIAGQNALVARGCMDFCYEKKCKAISWLFKGGEQNDHECRIFDSSDLKQADDVYWSSIICPYP